jgi:hypothetical protein
MDTNVRAGIVRMCKFEMVDEEMVHKSRRGRGRERQAPLTPLCK